MKTPEELIAALKSRKDYWQGIHPNDTKQALEGFMFSVLTLIDGCSGESGPIALVDHDTNTEINKDVCLHEML